MAGTRGCLLVACLLVAAAGAQTSAAATAADHTGLLQNTWRQGSLMGSTHIRQLKVGRCRHIHLVHVTVHLCAHCTACALHLHVRLQDARHHQHQKQLQLVI